MTTACPYCGAALNLNYCVVCGRQNLTSINKMGSLKTVARNTDPTQRIEDPLETKKLRYKQFLRYLNNVAFYLLKIIVGGLMIAALILIVINQATDLFKMQSMIKPWMKTHRVTFPGNMQFDVDSIRASMNKRTHTESNKSKLHHIRPKHKNKNRQTKEHY